MFRSTSACTLLLGLAMLPIAAAAPQGLAAAFAATTIAWTTEDSTREADVVALELSRPIGSDNLAIDAAPAQLAGNPFFGIKATAIQVDTDHADLFLDNPLVMGPIPPNTPATPSPTVRSTSESFTSAKVEGTASREGRFLLVFPLSDLKVSVPCATAEAATGRSEVRAQNHMGARPDLVNSTAEALEIRPCPTSLLNLTGSFVVVLWEWDGSIEAAGRTIHFWSGKHALPGADARPFLTEARQIYLTVLDGTLTLPGDLDRPPRLFVDDLDVESTEATLRKATGQIPLGRFVRDEDIGLTGNLQLQLSRNEGAVAIGVEGLRAVNGQEIQPAAVAVQQQDAALTWLLFAFFGVVASPLVLVPVRRRRRQARVSQLLLAGERRFSELDFAAALQAADTALRLSTMNAEAHMLRARVMEQQGDWPAANHHRDTADRLLLANDDAALRADNAVEAAHVRSHDPATARRWILRALQASPAALDEMVGLPTLLPIIEQLEAELHRVR